MNAHAQGYALGMEQQHDDRDDRRPPSEDAHDRPLSVSDLGAWLGWSHTFIYRLIREEGLPTHKAGGKRYFLRREVEAWLGSREG